MKYFLFFFVLITACNSVNQKEVNLTYFEQSQFKKTPRYDETLSYCKLLDNASDNIRYTSFGISPQGRELPLLIAGTENSLTAKKSKKNKKLVILIQAAVHAGEPDGKDAGLMLFRDIATKPEFVDLLEHVTLIFIPIFNVDGHERFSSFNRINQNGPDSMGWRTTAQNYNLNRDYLKAEAPETQAWLKLYNEWRPDFFIDCHTTDGADYQYVLTYGLETHGNMDSSLTHWQEEIYLPFIKSEMEKVGYPIFPYVMFKQWHDPRSGLIAYASSPMLSQGYTALRNCPGLLVETHMLKDYKTRVFSTYEIILKSWELLAKNHESYKELRKKSNENAKSENFRKKKLSLDFENSGDSTMVTFKGVEYTSEYSDLTGGIWFKYQTNNKKDFNLPYFNKLTPKTEVVIPKAYIIPSEWKQVVGKLRMHGVKVKTVSKNEMISATRYRFSNVSFKPTSFEGRTMLQAFDLQEFNDSIELKIGDFIVYTEQPLVRVIVHMLEPKAPSSLLKFGFFNIIFEQKEYSESYVMEPMAREMLAKNDKLKTEYDSLKNLPEIKQNPYALINWFYSKTPYWDKNLNVYPISKIE